MLFVENIRLKSQGIDSLMASVVTINFHPDRFGSSYFQINPIVSARTTFCYPDSYFEPEDFAVFNR
ncbi:hypothetical protein VCRA2123O444_140047 [Vibrio crassostreae]|nr:hypothetical protein VCRA2118O429_100026 [Vibrio crassostreae]CAK1694243.1 hypothetical protein VCRA2113O412_100026 [Vibrio crassostreae]CAK1708123.1 hypothetical protein VCRA2113O414_100156 [Vibrio crassostreae]CAK1709226.1 hypothetical protein VCRA2113O418_100156 [Vibrio crassostreae]CAK1725393.1 hypothetical protein VCRA2119O432_110156 [Vibrio crassostreae]